MAPLIETAPLRDAIITYTEQNLVGVDLASSDAYVLVNAHPQSACNFPGAAWLFGKSNIPLATRRIMRFRTNLTS